ncbi:MAG: hypothetical protein ACXVP5_11520 [Tumebacillaceae bacterium]
MPGIKTFSNRSGLNLSVTLFVRESSNPANNANKMDFNLGAHETKTITYGNYRDIYLNGYAVVASHAGAMVSRQEFVIDRGNWLDNRLNMNSWVDIYYEDYSFDLRYRN